MNRAIAVIAWVLGSAPALSQTCPTPNHHPHKPVTVVVRDDSIVAPSKADTIHTYREEDALIWQIDPSNQSKYVFADDGIVVYDETGDLVGEHVSDDHCCMAKANDSHEFQCYPYPDKYGPIKLFRYTITVIEGSTKKRLLLDPFIQNH